MPIVPQRATPETVEELTDQIVNGATPLFPAVRNVYQNRGEMPPADEQIRNLVRTYLQDNRNKMQQDGRTPEEIQQRFQDMRNRLRQAVGTPESTQRTIQAIQGTIERFIDRIDDLDRRGGLPPQRPGGILNDLLNQSIGQSMVAPLLPEETRDAEPLVAAAPRIAVVPGRPQDNVRGA